VDQVRFGEKEAWVYAEVETELGTYRLEARIGPEGRNVLLNGDPVPLKEVYTLPGSVLLGPEDQELVYGGKEERRNFLDRLLSRFSERYRVEVFAAFRERGLILVAPDYPPLPGLPPFRLVPTSSTAYLRLSGRNRSAWHEATSAAERYDYRYSPDELKGFVEVLKAHEGVLQEAWVIFNNTSKGHALFNLETFRSLFEAAGLGPGPKA